MREGKAARDPEGTKRAILKAAEEVFADKGFAGATISEISRKSGASGPLILFHFQNKEGLYESVKDGIVDRWRDRLQPKPVPVGAGPEFVSDMIEVAFSFYRDNPRMVRMANWGRLEGDDAPWGGEEDIHHWYESSIKEAQSRGEIRNDVSPLTITAMVCGTVHVWWEFHGHMEEHVRQGSYSEVKDDDYLEQITAIILKGLTP